MFEILLKIQVLVFVIDLIWIEQNRLKKNKMSLIYINK
jgi:hypothetical protein